MSDNEYRSIYAHFFQSADGKMVLADCQMHVGYADGSREAFDHKLPALPIDDALDIEDFTRQALAQIIERI